MLAGTVRGIYAPAEWLTIDVGATVRNRLHARAARGVAHRRRAAARHPARARVRARVAGAGVGVAPVRGAGVGAPVGGQRDARAGGLVVAGAGAAARDAVARGEREEREEGEERGGGRGVGHGRAQMEQ